MSSVDNSNGSNGDSIKVYLRVRPPDQDNAIDSGQILTVQQPDVVILPCKPEPKVYTFDHVADIHTTQEAVFAAVGRRTIESCVAGYNSTIFAYGQTGSGKTFTMMGPDEADNFHHELRGVIPRSFEYLFSLVNREREKQGERFEFLCRVSFLEIYNEQVFDLLDSASSGLQLRENFKRGVFVDGLIEQVVSNPSDAFQVLSTGWLNRRVASTSMNRESSRSHAVFTFTIQTKEKKAGVSNIRVSQLNLVDLAGSERQKDTKTSGIRLKEAGSINKSLLTLGHVITALVDIGHGKTRHVPYRDSKLSFLLRDSLGGNAKTYIIANVHPGAKCFGETLSTLNFARRAKMIKNKAVVNEDTQGNTLHLQMEIKRLREQLLQYRHIPQDPNTSGMHTPTSLTTPSNAVSAIHGNGEKKWRSYFLDAMYLREKTDIEKKNLLEKISRLGDLSNKKEQYLQSTKMIVRFRENTIARLQKSQANEEATEDQMVNDLKNEIGALKQQLSHNPTVTQYAMENRNLRNENKKLMALQTVRSAIEHDHDRSQHLEKVFRELMASIEGGDRRTSVCPSPSRTPSQHGDQHMAVSSTIDKYKTQCKQMQAERDTARQELLEQTEVMRQTQLKLEAEVASYKKTVNELENALEAFKVKTKIERDTMNNLHMRTIMTITTPKKVAHNLRNRVVIVPSAGDGTPINPRRHSSLPEDLSPLRDQEGIVDEEIPEHMIEQCNEALTEEVRKLQEENSRLLQSLQDGDTCHLKLKQTQALLERELEQIKQLLESEQQQKMGLKSEASKLSARLEDMQKDYCIAKSEAEDMRIMLQSADKVMEEEKNKLREAATQRERDVAALESKVLRIELELSTAEREMEKLTEEKRELQDVGNTLQEEVNFKEQRQEELESVIREGRDHRQTMAEEIQSLMEKLDGEFEKNVKLSAELREGSDSKQQLVESLEVMERLQTDNSQLQNLCSEKDTHLTRAKDDLDAAGATIVLLQKRAAEDKDALANMVTTVQDLRQTILLKENSLNMTAHELEDSRYQCETLQAAQDEYKNEVQGLQRELEEMTEEMSSLSCTHNMQMEMLQSDLDEVRGQYESLMGEMTEQEKHLQTVHAECEASASQVDSLKKQVSQCSVFQNKAYM
ncbi:kinesin-like protein KIF15 [Patiria miniata]|uniref:Kinesin motor domain-containing protein n=1 Tax=Patiria miniata TaxID=46514 RepID=A0A914BQY6_PATMI|nr:kinesin-like protein KIF15 [Patiria miniata]